MSNVIRELIEGAGIRNYRTYPGNIKYFTEVTSPEKYHIPLDMPAVGSIISISAEPVLLSKKLIDTPAAKSLEGNKLLGSSLVIDIGIKQIIKYEPSMPDMGVKIINMENIIHGVLIPIPRNVNGITSEELFKQNKIVISPYIEDVFAESIDKRTIYKNVVLFINAEIKA